MDSQAIKSLKTNLSIPANNLLIALESGFPPEKKLDVVINAFVGVVLCATQYQVEVGIDKKPSKAI